MNLSFRAFCSAGHALVDWRLRLCLAFGCICHVFVDLVRSWQASAAGPSGHLKFLFWCDSDAAFFVVAAALCGHLASAGNFWARRLQTVFACFVVGWRCRANCGRNLSPLPSAAGQSPSVAGFLKSESHCLKKDEWNFGQRLARNL